MTNLSDLFPAGAGKQVSFTADGNITAAGKPVILNADGTAAQVGESSGNEGIGGPVVFEEAAATTMANVYDSNSNKMVIAYDDGGNSAYGTARVGTVDGTSITFGDPEVFDTNAAESIAATFDSNSNKIVVAYRDGGTGYGYVVIGTVSGTDITFGTRVAFNSANTTGIGPNGIAFDPDTNQVVIAFRDDGNSDYGTAIVGAYDGGTSMTFGAEATIETDQTSYHSVVYDTNTNRIVIAYRHDSGSGYGKAKVGEISGTSITLGASTDFLGASTSLIAATFDSSQNKVVIAYSGTSSYGTGIVGEVTGGVTNTIAFAGSEEVFNSASTGPIAPAVFDTNLNKTIVGYCNSVAPFYGYAVRGTVSGTAITFSTPFLIASTQVSATFGASYDASSNNVVFSYRDVDNSNYGTAVVYTDSATNLTSTNFLGIADAIIADTTSGNVTIKGGIASTGLSSLTPASDYYVQDDGTITTVTSDVKAGKALSATSINLEYQS